MLSAFANAFRTPDLRRKLLFVLMILTIFRLGSTIPTPGVTPTNAEGAAVLSQHRTAAPDAHSGDARPPVRLPRVLAGDVRGPHTATVQAPRKRMSC